MSNNVRRGWRSMLAVAAAAGWCGGAAQAAPVQWTSASGGNDQWYEFVSQADSGGFQTWTAAETAASASTHSGMTGYLATITSQEENDFIIASVSTTLGWIGGSDEGAEETWSWRTGPEAGQVFFILGGGTQPGYSSWSGGEPNNSGAENYVVTNWGGPGNWNDLGDDANWGQGYFVEYSAVAPVPVPAALPLMGSALAALGLLRRKRKTAA